MYWVALTICSEPQAQLGAAKSLKLSMDEQGVSFNHKPHSNPTDVNFPYHIHPQQMQMAISQGCSAS